MTQIAAENDLQSSMRKLDGLLEQVQKIADPATREVTSQIVQTMMEFHGAGLAKILERIAEAGALGDSIINDLAHDDLVSSLMLLYGQHPLELDERVRAALEKVRPYLKSHGGNVELLSISDDGAVQLQLQGSCHGCPSSSATMKNTIEQAIYDLAPDVTAILVASVEEPEAPHGSNGFVPVEQLLIKQGKQKHSLQGIKS